MTPPRESLLRFGRTSRVVHALVGSLVLVCILTAAILYNGSLSIAVGHRHTVRQIHVWCGFALPVPLLFGLASRLYRDDLGRLNRFTADDRRWLRSPTRRSGTIRVGKFNAGQKLNAAASAGAIATLFLTGAVMYFHDRTRLSWRSGATFTHDWFALGLGILVLGHLSYALRDPIALRAMRTGKVPTAWARREHEAWVDELERPTLEAWSPGAKPPSMPDAASVVWPGSNTT
jgi:formate dehydrogenase subunit gamma